MPTNMACLPAMKHDNCGWSLWTNVYHTVSVVGRALFLSVHCSWTNINSLCLSDSDMFFWIVPHGINLGPNAIVSTSPPSTLILVNAILQSNTCCWVTCNNIPACALPNPWYRTSFAPIYIYQPIVCKQGRKAPIHPIWFFLVQPTVHPQGIQLWSHDKNHSIFVGIIDVFHLYQRKFRWKCCNALRLKHAASPLLTRECFRILSHSCHPPRTCWTVAVVGHVNSSWSWAVVHPLRWNLDPFLYQNMYQLLRDILIFKFSWIIDAFVNGRNKLQI